MLLIVIKISINFKCRILITIYISNKGFFLCVSFSILKIILADKILDWIYINMNLNGILLISYVIKSIIFFNNIGILFILFKIIYDFLFKSINIRFNISMKAMKL